MILDISRRSALATPLIALPAAAGAQAPPVALVEVGTQGWLFPVWENLANVDLGVMRTNLQTVTEAIGIIRAARIQLTMLILPSRKRLMRQFHPPGMTVTPAAAQRYSITMAEARRVGALVPDLDTLFRERIQRDPVNHLFWKTDSHWTPVGAELAAVEIARQIRETFNLPASQRTGIRLGDLRPIVLAAGDYTLHLPPSQRANFGPEESLIRQILPQEGAAALLEDDSFDTVVVGTSNVQPRFGFSAVLSNQLVRPVGLFWRPHNLGPYFAMLEYLRSEAFRRQRPAALVWNLLELDLMNSTSNRAWGTAAMPAAEFLAQLRRSLG